jgi:hypothetical protein
MGAVHGCPRHGSLGICTALMPPRIVHQGLDLQSCLRQANADAPGAGALACNAAKGELGEGPCGEPCHPQERRAPIGRTRRQKWLAALHGQWAPGTLSVQAFGQVGGTSRCS